MNQYGGDLSAIDIAKCKAQPDEICGSNTIWWVIVVILVLIILGVGGYLGYQYYQDNLCFRDENNKQCATKKS